MKTIKKILLTALLLPTLCFNAFSKYDFNIILNNLTIDSSNSTTIYTHISWCQAGNLSSNFLIVDAGGFYYGPPDSAKWFFNGSYITTTLDSQSFAADVPGIYMATGYKWGIAIPSKSIIVFYSGTCPTPLGLIATNIKQTSAKVKWTLLPCAAGYKVQYRVAGTSTWTTKKIANNVGGKLLTGLNAATTYNWRVATKCIANSQIWSAWSSIQSFSTTTTFSNISITDKTGNEAIADKEINIYPNPAKNDLTIEFNARQPGKKAETMNIEILNVMGEVLLKNKITATQGMCKFDVSSLRSGVYLVKLTSGNYHAMQRFIIE